MKCCWSCCRRGPVIFIIALVSMLLWDVDPERAVYVTEVRQSCYCKVIYDTFVKSVSMKLMEHRLVAYQEEHRMSTDFVYAERHTFRSKCSTYPEVTELRERIATMHRRRKTATGLSTQFLP